MIKQQQDEYSWKFIFLGANIDAQAVADDIGIPVDAAHDLRQRHDYAANRVAYEAVSAKCPVCAGASSNDASFDPESSETRRSAERSGATAAELLWQRRPRFG